ncbi:hypothetical protein NUW54_g2841 [Trametes sanguinea]|uniref:Uncharacterized protein n=1 Tax=Trametes sanguinea TaxID=158606 RepID=A0ACC1Q591_9APHY|nr:hypothetical protein NUW54_g2841 [Trametes sanguinea]
MLSSSPTSASSVQCPPRETKLSHEMCANHAFQRFHSSPRSEPVNTLRTRDLPVPTQKVLRSFELIASQKHACVEQKMADCSCARWCADNKMGQDESAMDQMEKRTDVAVHVLDPDFFCYHIASSSQVCSPTPILPSSTCKMASIGTLYTIPEQVQGKAIRAAAAFNGLKIDLPENYVHFESNKTPEFLAKFPHGKIPAFDGADGFKLFESTAIARYVAALAPNSTLLGSNLKEAALVDQWVSFANTEIGAQTTLIFQLVKGILTPYAKPIHTTLAERQIRSFKTLEAHLATRTFLVNERITLADIFMAAIIQRALLVTLDAPLRAQFPNIIRHFETIVNQPQLKDIFGKTEYIDKALAFTPPPKEKKEAKPAAAPAPKAAKPAKEEEEEDDVPKEEPKAKNPLDSLPKSSFNLEDWKRAYSNKDTRGPDGALEWFYQK